MLFKCSPSVFYHNVFTSGSIFPLTILPLPKSIGQRKSSVSASDLLLLWPNIPCFFTLKIEQLNQWRIPQSFSSRPIPCFFTLKIEKLDSEESHSPSVTNLQSINYKRSAWKSWIKGQFLYSPKLSTSLYLHDLYC